MRYLIAMIAFAVTTAQAATPAPIISYEVPTQVVNEVLAACSKEWPNQYQMQVWCVKSQLDSFVELSKLRDKFNIKGEKID